MRSWRWALHSPARLGLTVLAVLAVVWAGSALLTPRHTPARPPTAQQAPAPATRTPTTPPPTHTATASTSPTPAKTTIPPLHPTTPVLPAAQARAMVTFVTVWASHRPAAAWHDAIHPLVDRQLFAGLARTDPQTIAATRVTGQPRASIVGPRGSEALVPTDAGPVALRVGLYGRRWLITLIEQG